MLPAKAAEASLTSPIPRQRAKFRVFFGPDVSKTKIFYILGSFHKTKQLCAWSVAKPWKAHNAAACVVDRREYHAPLCVHGPAKEGRKSVTPYKVLRE